MSSVHYACGKLAGKFVASNGILLHMLGFLELNCNFHLFVDNYRDFEYFPANFSRF